MFYLVTGLLYLVIGVGTAFGFWSPPPVVAHVSAFLAMAMVLIGYSGKSDD